MTIEIVIISISIAICAISISLTYCSVLIKKHETIAEIFRLEMQEKVKTQETLEKYRNGETNDD